MSHCQSHRQSSCCSSRGCGCHSISKIETCGTGCQTSCCSHQKNGECAEKFLELADAAWMEVLKEKMKDKIRANCSHLDELACLVAESNQERWKKKIAAKTCCESFEGRLKEFFGQSCQSCRK